MRQRHSISTRSVGQHRSPSERERQRNETLDLFLRAVPTGEIAHQMGVHRNQVTRDLATARQTFLVEQRATRNERIAQELTRIDNLERTYWEAWERSLEEQIRTVTAREDVPIDGPTGARQRTEGDEEKMPPRMVMLTRTKAQRRVDHRGQGNPAFLAGIQWCIDRRIRLLGLDEPVTVNVEARVRAVAEELGVDLKQVEAAVRDVHAVWKRSDHGSGARRLD